MKYKDNQISTLNKSIISFWNAGKKTIDKSDLVPERMIIDFSENNHSLTHFISYKVSKQSRNSIQVDLFISETNNIEFNFNYLDYKDYFEIEILHTGKIIPSQIKGDIKGVPKGLLNVSNKAKKLQDEAFDILISSGMGIIDSISSIKDLFNKK